MQRHRERDPVALFEFALAESDWVLAALIAGALRGTAGMTGRLSAAVEHEARTGRAAPATLGELAAWARIARLSGLGSG